MLKVTQVEGLTAQQISKNGQFQVIGVEKSFAYVDGAKTERLDGMKYECLLPGQKFERVKVKVPTSTSTLEKSVIDEANDSGTQIFVSWEGFTAKFYWSDRIKNYDITCR